LDSCGCLMTSPSTDKSDRPAIALSPLAQRGNSHVKAIVTILLLSSIVGALLGFAADGIEHLFRGIISFAITLSLSVKLLEGRAWARWLVAAFNGFVGIIVLLTAIDARASGNPDVVAFLGILSVASIAVSAALAFLPTVAAFFAETRSGRVGGPTA
jgi:hypothetical protein